MASQNPKNRTPMYPQIDPYPNPNNPIKPSSSSSSLYPEIDMKDLVENLFPDEDETLNNSPSAPPQSVEETLITIPGTILHLIDKQYSVELACGDLAVVRLSQGDNVVAVFVRVNDEIQWPLTKDEAVVKLDDTHYFFSFKAPKTSEDSDGVMLSYGLTIASRGQEGLLLRGFDEVLGSYGSFSVERVEERKGVLDGMVARELSPEDLKVEKKRKTMENKCRACQCGGL